MSRHPSRPVIAPLARSLALALTMWAACAADARAAYLFSGPASEPGAITLFTNGNMSGSTPIDLLSPIWDNSGPAHTITAGVLSFNPGRGLAGTPTTGYAIAFGGSFAVVGSLDGGPAETLLDCPKILSGGHVDYLGPVPGGAAGAGRYRLEATFAGFLAGDVAAVLYVKPGIVLGVFMLEFSGIPGGAMDGGAVGSVRFDVTATAPEPASIGMVAAGLMMAGWAAGRRRAVSRDR